MPFPRSIVTALSRARLGIVTIVLTHLISLLVGAAMVHTGNQFALQFGDDLVARAHASDPASISLAQGNPMNAAIYDFGRNLLLAAVPNTIAGVGVIIPYPAVAYRGWVGGIVTVDRNHNSRFSDPAEALYLIVTLILQIVPYSLAVGAGVNLGIAYYRPSLPYRGKRWFGFPKEAVLDVLRIYVLVVPLFFVASLWEFLAR